MSFSRSPPSTSWRTSCVPPGSTFDFHRYLAHHAFANETAVGPHRIPATQYDPVWSQQAWDRTFRFLGQLARVILRKRISAG